LSVNNNGCRYYKTVALSLRGIGSIKEKIESMETEYYAHKKAYCSGRGFQLISLCQNR